MEQWKGKWICRCVLSAALSLAMVTAVLIKAGIYFETNDDRLIAEMLSGVAGGEPDAHAVYVNGLLSWPLAMLYRFLPQLPWYGMCLIALQALVYFLLLDSVLACCSNGKQAIGGAAAVAGFFLLYLYFAGLIQYTATAILLALAGYICLLLRTNRKAGLILFGIATLLSYCLRSSSMLMVQPLGMAVYTGLVLMERKESLKQKAIRVGEPLIIVGAVLLIGWCSNAAGYRGEEWRRFEKHVEANVAILDYYGGPPYDEVKGILDKYGATRAEYEAYLNNIILDWDITPECAAEIAEYAKAHSERKTLEEFAGEYWKYRWENNYWGINRMTVLLLAAAIICIALCGQYALFLPLGFLEAAKMLVWLFLIYRGRMPMRVILPLFACETALLFVLILKSLLRTKKWEKWKIAVFLALGCLFCWQSFVSGRQQYRYIKEQNEGQKVFMRGMREIEDYCREHSENKYLLDAVSMSYYKGSALETEIYRPRNSMVTGCWYSHSPVTEKAQKEYLKADGRGVHLIVYEDGRGLEHPAVVYLQEETESKPELVEKFTASHGGTYLVWYFPGEIIFDES